MADILCAVSLENSHPPRHMDIRWDTFGPRARQQYVQKTSAQICNSPKLLQVVPHPGAVGMDLWGTSPAHWALLSLDCMHVVNKLTCPDPDLSVRADEYHDREIRETDREFPKPAKQHLGLS